jgi:hypothetical protein
METMPAVSPLQTLECRFVLRGPAVSGSGALLRERGADVVENGVHRTRGAADPRFKRPAASRLCELRPPCLFVCVCGKFRIERIGNQDALRTRLKTSTSLWEEYAPARGRNQNPPTKRLRMGARFAKSFLQRAADVAEDRIHGRGYVADA